MGCPSPYFFAFSFISIIIVVVVCFLRLASTNEKKRMVTAFRRKSWDTFSTKKATFGLSSLILFWTYFYPATCYFPNIAWPQFRVIFAFDISLVSSCWCVTIKVVYSLVGTSSYQFKLLCVVHVNFTHKGINIYVILHNVLTVNVYLHLWSILHYF